MKSFLKLIRWQNLVIVALTMVLMRYALLDTLLGEMQVFIIQGKIGEAAMQVQFPLINFILLVAVTVLITAGGYIINDYFDINTDIINRGEAVVGSQISQRQAMTLHNLFNLIGVGLGFYISWRSGYTLLGVLFLVVSGLLYFYSASYKRQLLIGNVIVALLAAMVPMLVAIYEWSAVYRFYAINAAETPDLSFIFYWIGGFALFAFLTTLTREIIKDIEDYEGDAAYGHDTVPIVLGILTSKIIVIALITITLAALYAVWYLFVFDYYTLVYISAFIAIPLAFVIITIFRSTNRRQFRAASRLMKAIMLAGILYSLVVKAIINWGLV